MDRRPGEIRTSLVDLTNASIEDLRHCDGGLIEPSLRRLLRQIERPRVNLGSGPPGRVD